MLLVDDDAITRTMAKSVLLKAGFRVSEASDGASGLAHLENRQDFALMVLDLDMPVMGGREVLAQVRKSAATMGLPVLVLTGSGSEELEAQIMDEGADDYIRKPLDPARFVARVKAALRWYEGKTVLTGRGLSQPRGAASFPASRALSSDG